MSRVLLQASLTGLFCVVFAIVVDTVTDALSLAPVIGLSFVSGFLGSLFAQFVLGRRLMSGSSDALQRQEK